MYEPFVKHIGKLLFSALAVFCIMITVSTVFGQVTAGRVTGSVLDPNGAAIVGSTVTLKNGATGLALTTETTGSGSFTFPNVLPGNYQITFESTGFQPVTQDVTVVLNQESAVNATLAVGGTGVTVDVTAASEALVQTESSQLGRTFQTQQVQNLPVFGNQNALALLSPNVVGQSSGTAGSGGTVGGVRPRYNVFTVDGVENNDPSVTGPSTSVIQDAVGEFTLLTNNFNAEFGQGGGGQFVTITRSGTNEFHGSGFAYLQNQHLNAASTSQERALKSGAITELPRFRDTRYGFTIGGPIVKNKAFFFGAFERRPTSREGSSTSFLAPTGAGLAQIAALPGASPFVVNLLRNNLTFPTSQTTTQTVLGVAGIPFGTVSTIIPAQNQDEQYQINGDYNPNEKNQFRFRFSHDDFSGIGAGNGNVKFNNNTVFQSRLFSATYVRAFSSAAVNELRLAYRHTANENPLVNDEFNNFPNITVTPLNLALGPDENLPQGGRDWSYQVFDTLSYSTGPHSFKFGADVRVLLATSNFLPRGRGDYVYTNFDELIQDNAPTSVDLRGVGSSAFTGNNKRFYFFGQDDWKVTQNLTLNLGLRYEFVTLPRDSNLQALNAISSIPGVLEFGVPKTDKNNFAPRLGFAYAPDFGGGIGRFLFGKNRESSIRGNFSTSFTEVFQNLILLELPPQFQQELDVATAEEAFNLNLQTNFLMQGGVPPTPIPPTTRAAARAGTGSFIEDQRFGEIYAFALSYQRSLGKSLALEVRYLGTRGRHLPVQLRINGGTTNRDALTIPTFLSAPTAAQLAGLTTLGAIKGRSDVSQFPLDSFTAADEQFGGFVTAFKPVGNSQYDSGSISLTSRNIGGLGFTTAYTFSKTISDSDNELFTSRVNPRRSEDIFNLRRERSLSTFDIPHRFVFAANYEPTFFNNKGRVMKALFGDFVFAPIFQAQSGQPFTPNAGIDANLDFDSAGDRAIFNANGVEGTGSAVRAINAAGASVPLRSNSTVAYVAVNPNAQYIQTGPGARSTAGRNTLRSKGFNRTDLTVLKNFKFGEERYNIQVGTEIFNLWNQRIQTIGGVGATSSAFANVGSTFFNNYSIGDFPGRTIQFRAKFLF